MIWCCFHIHGQMIVFLEMFQELHSALERFGERHVTQVSESTIQKLQILLAGDSLLTSYGATRKYKGAPGETASISSSFGPVLSDCIYTNSGLLDELVGKFEKVLFSLNFPGAGESDRMTMTFVFDVIASGGERSSGSTSGSFLSINTTASILYIPV
ncbi:hypothetical protein DPX16_21922 [Anabarilius grahami]|uniref:Uncharacterized protein n=1 Tax=Anabarilius grahami TaxID=495550 RepID=A0A3N0XPZ6_ANAGA|nr:hypothetical protein DPX16_21922 [Anabarilius grahami]